MKKISIVLLLVLALAQISLAQKSFLIMPEMKTGCAVADVIDNGNYNTAFHFNVGLTLGMSDKNEYGTNFYGVYIAGNGHSYIVKKSRGKSEVIARGSSTIGMQILHRTNSKLIYGGIIGVNIWEDYYENYTNDDIEDIDYTGNILIKGKVGYSWSHVALFIETGYNKGAEFDLGISLPLNWK